jgi:hypothetical protein
MSTVVRITIPVITTTTVPNNSIQDVSAVSDANFIEALSNNQQLFDNSYAFTAQRNIK